MTGKRANLNKFAHPRNPYKTGLGDLDEVAKSDPDFGSFAKRKDNGKVTADWTDREYTRKLMRSIIKRDFQLDLDSPVGSLAPALTNKLNYLLWIEDLSKLNNVQEVQGIDIGSGAAMYFAAIAVKHFQWSMLATESNEEDYNIALQNLRKNALEQKLTLVKTDVKGEIFKIDGSFFFSLCNPPFYEVNEERREREDIEESTGRNHEVATDGGEIEFVNKMIQESRAIQNKVKVFSSLIGHKRNVSVLRETLKGIPDVKASTVTELCQGRTMRWVLAWTYHPDIKLELPTPRSEFKNQEKQGKPIIFDFDTESNLQEISATLKTHLSEINVQVAKEGKRDDMSSYLRLKTTKTDWRGQRAKRRLLEKGPSCKKMKLDTDEDMDIEESVKLDCQLYLNKKEDKVAFQFVFLNGEVGKGTMDYFRRGDIHPREETMVNEFKGHRSFCVDEIPRLALSGFNNPGNRPSRQPISKYACGMLNTGRGGTIFMGILDDGRIDGFMMSKYQQDHVRLSIQDTFDRYAPPVPPHLYKITFKPVIDKDPQFELRAIYDFYAQEDRQNRDLNHLIQASDHCWCDANSMAMFSRGCLNPFFVIELKLQAWNPDDPLNKKLFEEGASKPKFKAEDGIAYIRKFGSNHAMTDQKV